MTEIDFNIFEKRQQFIAKAAMTISFVALGLFIAGIIIMLTAYYFYFLSYIILIPVSILNSLSLVLGAISYFGPYRVKYGLVAFIISIVLTSLNVVVSIFFSFGIYRFYS